jgi:chemotaxis methyl-accepting protein methylase
LPAIIELLRGRTNHDFRLYKPGTLRRRIERRMAMAAIAPERMDLYLAVLGGDGHELDLLAKDLLINITSFFRDPEVFDLLSRTTIPDLVSRHPAGPTASDLDRRLQHRRGNLLPGHAVHRADRRRQARHQASAVRLRR